MGFCENSDASHLVAMIGITISLLLDIGMVHMCLHVKYEL